jgi:peptidoglycan/LPS O-acetylase OafA/YrhL
VRPVDRTAARRPALDGLRALAALGVVVHHSWQYSGRSPAGLGLWWQQLALGVALFFCLSGFLVYAPWARVALDRTARIPRLGRFYALRAARILPLYWLTIVAAVAVLHGTGHWRLVDDWRLAGFAVLAQNYVPSLAGKLNPPTWTLVVEASFYVLVPLIGWLALRAARGRRHARVAQLAVLAALTAGSVAWAAVMPPPPVVRTTLLDVVGLFCVGMAARVLVEGRRVPRALGRTLLIAGAGLVWLHATGRLGHPLGGALRDLPAGLGFALICVACAQADAPRLLGWRPLAYLGTLSYGIYLWHYVVLLGLQSHGLVPHDDVVATVALVGLPAIALAALTWHGLEQPVLRAVRRRLDRERVPLVPRATASRGGRWRSSPVRRVAAASDRGDPSAAPRAPRADRRRSDGPTRRAARRRSPRPRAAARTRAG